MKTVLRFLLLALTACCLRAGQTDEDRIYAVAVASLRPSVLQWKQGDFGIFRPAERIYARVVNLCRLGDDPNNYACHVCSTDALDLTAFDAGSKIIAHGKLSVIAYVTESDVARVQNARRTYMRMQAFLLREARVSHYQARATGPKVASAITPIIPGRFGSIIISGEGQGYEMVVLRTVSDVNYFVSSMPSINAMTAGGVPNEWTQHWTGKAPVMLPIAAGDATWGLRVYSAATNYEGLANARVAALPAWWDDDVR